MTKSLQTCFYAILLILFTQVSAFAQNCTINAGSDRTICPGTPFVLTGTAGGNFTSPPVWTQVSGPAVTVSTTTVNSGAATATVSGYSPDVSYTFRLTAKCTDGTPIQDDAIYTASPLTVANAGLDQNVCPGTFNMSANAVKAGETGTWTRISGSLPLPSPASTTGGAAQTGSINIPTTNAGTTVYRWTITSSSGSCISTDDVLITNLGGVAAVSAGSDFSVSCYTVTASAQLSGSYGGSSSQPLQRGTWTFISGPSTPTFDNIHVNNTTIRNLIGGVYKIRWTVAGQCVNGSADVTINVDSPSQDVTNAGGGTITYCDGRTSTILNGVKPLYANESVTWTASSSNPAGATLSATNTPNVIINGLNGMNNYSFTYKITNSVTNCSSTGTYTIRYTVGPSINLGLTSPQLLPCGISQLDIPYTVAGGTGTEWALISGPAGSTIQLAHNYGVYTASNSPQTIVGMNLVGTYVIRFKRATDNASGGCTDAFQDITIITSNPPYTANAGTPQILACGVLSTSLAGNQAQGSDSGIGQWSQVSGPNTAVIADKSLYNTGISGLVSGVYIFRWIVSGGYQCGETQSDVKVTVGSLPTVVNAGTDILGYCYGTPLKLNGNIPADNETGTWTVFSESPTLPASTIVFSNINDPAAVVTGLLSNKTYVFRWSISNSCGTITNEVTVTTSNTAGARQAVVTSSPACIPSGTTSFTITGNAPLGGEVGTWSLLPGAPNTPVFNTNTASQTVTGAVNGTYKFVWTLTAGSCNPTSDTVTVTISPATTTASITGAPSQTVCGLGPLNLVGNTPAATELGTWTQTGGPGGAIITLPNSPTTTVTGLIEGRYTFTWSITNNSCSSSSSTITYTLNEPPSAAVAGSNITLCNATSTPLAANTITVGTGLWSVISGPNTPTFSSFSNPTATLSNLTLGVYTLRWTSSNGPYCTPSSSTVTVTVSQVANAGVDQQLCNTTTTVLSGNEGSTGTFTQVGNTPNTATLTRNSNNTFIASGLIPGTYTFNYNITSGGCTTFDDQVTVVVSGPPSVADAGADKELCKTAGSSVSLSAVTPAVGTGKWVILSQPSGGTAALADPLSNTSALNNLITPGVYLLKWEVSVDNCAGTQSNNDIARVTVYDPPTTAQPMINQPNACVDKVTLTATVPTIGVGTWTFIPVDRSDTRTPIFSAVNSAVTSVTGLAVDPRPYTFRWTITNGTCTPSSADVVVTVKDQTPTTASVSSPTTSVCTNVIGGTGSIALSGNTATVGTGTWTQTGGPGGATITSPNSPTTTVSGLIQGSYTFAWTIANLATACTTVATETVTVYDPPSVSIPGSNASFCLFSQVTMGATAPTSGIGTWTVTAKPSPTSPTPVFSSVNDPHAVVTGLVSGVYEFTWTTSNGPCTTSANTVNITITDCQIAVSKEAATPVLQSDKSFNVTFKFRIKNTGGIAVNNVQVQDDLSITFPSPKTYTIVSIGNPGGLTVNTGFNGNSNKNLFVGTSSLAAGAEEIVTVVANVKLN